MLAVGGAGDPRDEGCGWNWKIFVRQSVWRLFNRLLDKHIFNLYIRTFLYTDIALISILVLK